MRRTRIVMSAAVVLAAGIVANASAQPVYEHVMLPHDGRVVLTIATADFDNDGNLDVVLGSLSNPSCVVVAFGDGNGGFPDSVTLVENNYHMLTCGFVNDDEFPDIVAAKLTTGNFAVYLSNGDRTFASPIEFTGHASSAYGVTIGYINDDAYADVIFGSDPVVWYSGDGTGNLTYEGQAFGGVKANSVGLLDLNGDAYTDAVVLQRIPSSVRLYLGDGQGGFTNTENLVPENDPYPAQFSLGHSVVDFDEDGNADLLFTEALPAVQGDSKATVMMTDGTGHIKDTTTFIVEGTCYGLTAIDFNDDNHLDIVAASSSAKHVDILLGDGSGGIADVLSFSTDSIAVLSLVTGDYREDGLWDFAVGAVETNSAVLLRADEPPLSLEGGEMITTVKGDLGLRVRNPQMLTVDDLRYHVAGARCEYRDADHDGALDKQITDLTVQQGDYRVSVWNTAVTGADPFSLPVNVAGVPLMLAKDAPVPVVGDTLHFAVHVGGGAAVYPPSGGVCDNLQPTFDWSGMVSAKSGATVYGIQISESWDFTISLYDVNDLTVPQFTPASELSSGTIYYWRYRAGDGLTWGDYSDIHAVTINLCNCPKQADIDGDGFRTAIDLGLMIDAMFAGSAADTTDAYCPNTRTDFDNDGFPTSLDLGGLIDHLFAGGPGPCDPCYPYQESCAF